jgi:hypothetical protein
MATLLKQKAQELEVPLIMYGEEAAFATGLHFLVQGDIVLCNPSTMIGNVGFVASPNMLKKFAEDWHF